MRAPLTPKISLAQPVLHLSKKMRYYSPLQLPPPTILSSTSIITPLGSFVVSEMQYLTFMQNAARKKKRDRKENEFFIPSTMELDSESFQKLKALL